MGHLGLSRLFRTQWALTIQWADYSAVGCLQFSGVFTTQWTVSPIQLTLSSCIHDTFASAMSSLTDMGFSYSLNVDPGYLIIRPIRVLHFTYKQKVKFLHFVVVLNMS